MPHDWQSMVLKWTDNGQTQENAIWSVYLEKNLFTLFQESYHTLADVRVIGIDPEEMAGDPSLA
jgi:hypothetical protein